MREPSKAPKLVIKFAVLREAGEMFLALPELLFTFLYYQLEFGFFFLAHCGLLIYYQLKLGFLFLKSRYLLLTNFYLRSKQSHVVAQRGDCPDFFNELDEAHKGALLSRGVWPGQKEVVKVMRHVSMALVALARIAAILKLNPNRLKELEGVGQLFTVEVEQTTVDGVIEVTFVTKPTAQLEAWINGALQDRQEKKTSS